MEIYKNNERINLENVLMIDYREQTNFLKTKLEQMTINFPVLKTLMGQKDILKLAFDQQKKESLD